MAIENYGDLKAAVQTWINRKDSLVVSNIPYFIEFATNDVKRLVRFPKDENSFQYNLLDDPNNPALMDVVLPSDFYELKHLTVNGRPYNRVDVETFHRLKTSGVNDSTVSLLIGQGSSENEYFFTRKADKLYFIPEVKSGDVVDIIYYEDYPEMVGDGDTITALEMAPDLMLYLALRHASIFLRDNDQAQYWEVKANDAGTRLIQRLDDIEWSGSALVVPSFKV